ncbi:hypothetical protein [Streptomyces sp. NPDC057580]|uniref:hypothetical protein n=1 Tax=Streptomyces sp. NPDC057580 TaxID=3346173 RepID=UPI0036B832E0
MNRRRGDVVHTGSAFQGEVHYRGDAESVAARRSLRRLRHLLDVHRVDLWIAHDTADRLRWGVAGEKR